MSHNTEKEQGVTHNVPPLIDKTISQYLPPSKRQINLQTAPFGWKNKPKKNGPKNLRRTRTPNTNCHMLKYGSTCYIHVFIYVYIYTIFLFFQKWFDETKVPFK